MSLDFEITANTEKFNEGIERAKARIKEAAEEIGKEVVTVGDYIKSGERLIAEQEIFVKSIKNQIQAVDDEIKNMSGASEAKDKLKVHSKELREELSREQEVVTDLSLATNDLKKGYSNIRTQILDLKNDLSALAVAGKQETQEYREKMKELERLSIIYRQISATATNVANQSMKMFQGVMQGVTAFTGGMSAVQGAVGLFAEKNEELQKIMLKVQSLMAITYGLHQITAAAHSTSAFMTTVFAKAQQFLARTLNISNAAAKGLTASLTLGLSVAIPVVISLINRLQSRNKAAREELEAHAEAIKEFQDKVAGYAQPTVTSVLHLADAWRRLGDDMEAKQKFIENNADAFKKLNVNIKDVADAENLFVANTNSFVTAMVKRGVVQKYSDDIKELVDNLIKANNDLQKIEENIGKEGVDFTSFADRLHSGAKSAFAAAKSYKEAQIAEIEKGISEMFDTLNDAMKEVDKILSDADIKPFEALIPDKEVVAKSLDDIKALYEQYYFWQDTKGKEVADMQFASLIKDGESYLAYLENMISKIELKPKMEMGDISKLFDFTKERDALLGIKTEFEQWADNIDFVKDGFSDLIDYTEYLYTEINKLGEDDGSEAWQNKYRTLTGLIFENELSIRAEGLKTFAQLMEYNATFAEERLAIERDYQEQVKKLGEAGLSPEAFDLAIEKANELRDALLEASQIDEFKSLEAFKRLTTNVRRFTKVEMREYLKTLENATEELKDQPAVYSLVLDLVNQIKYNIDQTNAKRFRDGMRAVLNTASELSDVIGQTNEGLAQTANQIVDIADSALQMLAATDPVSKVAGAVSLGIKAVNFLDKQFGFQKRAEDAEKKRIALIKALKFEYEGIEHSLERQIKLLSFDSGGGDKLLKEIEAYKTQYDEVLKTLGKERIQLGKDHAMSFLYFVNKAAAAGRDAREELQKMFADGIITEEEYNRVLALLDKQEQGLDSLADAQRAYRDYVAGSVEQLVGELHGLFKEGKLSAKDFADFTEKHLREAIINGIALKGVGEDLNKWIDAVFGAVTSDGGLTEQKMVWLTNWLEDITTENLPAFNAANEILDKVFGGVNKLADDTMKGAVKAITEDTAGVLVGHAMGMKITQAMQLDVMNSQLSVLYDIKNDTKHLPVLLDIRDLLQVNGTQGNINKNRAIGG